MKRAVYSVEIQVERDKTTGQTRVLSSHTKLPVDCSRGGVKVYEDEQKVVHEVNGQDGVHLLSAAEVDELILKADRAAERAAALADGPGRLRSGREIAAASADEAAPGGTGVSPREPIAVPAPGASDRDRGDEEEAERAPVRDGEAPPAQGGAEPEATAPPPTHAPAPQLDKRETAGGAVGKKKGRKCCDVM